MVCFPMRAVFNNWISEHKVNDYDKNFPKKILYITACSSADIGNDAGGIQLNPG